MQRGRFSSSAEYVLYASKGVPKDGELSPQNVVAVQPVNGEDKSHVAEKPEAVLRWLIGLTRPGDIVLDPFMGSGTTGVVCAETGRRFVGIEIDEGYCKRAIGRIAVATMKDSSKSPIPKKVNL